jgi:NAD(P)H dehydrogenase (quinone)
LAGKRAMLVVTTGGWESHYSLRRINGPIDDVLFPIQHGILYYPGFDVLPPFVVYRTSKIDETSYAQVRDALGQRLDDLWTAALIPFRQQNGGAYTIPQRTLRDEFAPDQAGFAAHVE